MRWAIGLLAAAVVAGCSSAPAPAASSDSRVVDGITIPPVYEPPPATVVPGPTACPAAFAATLTKLAHAAFTLRADRSTHLLTCSYQTAHAAPGNCSKASVRVNTEPQAFVAFDRWNVETGQNSMWSSNPKLQPVPVAGIGTLAEWVPALGELGTADATTWVSVFVTCPGSPTTVPQLARALALEGLASAG